MLAPRFSLFLGAIFIFSSLAFSQPLLPGDTSFTYQGQLNQDDTPLTGIVDMRFAVYDSETSGAQVSSAPLEILGIGVADGAFEVEVDFEEPIFDLNLLGAEDTQERWLEIEVRGSALRGDPYIMLSPRKRITPVPLAQYAGVADVAKNVTHTPQKPELVGAVSIGGNPVSVQVFGRYAYVIDNASKDIKVIDVSDPGAPTLIGARGVGSTSSPVAFDVTGRYAYQVDAAADDLKMIDLSIPDDPRIVGVLGIGGSPTDVKVSGRYAYVIDSESDDIKVINLSEPIRPTLQGAAPVGASPSAIFISGRYAYITDTDSGELIVMDRVNPNRPALAGSLTIGAAPVAVFASGRFAYVVDTESNDLKVIDIADPGNPGLVGSLPIGGSPSSFVISGTYAYVVDTESDDLKVIDISDSGEPYLAASLEIGGSPTSIAVAGRYAYVVDSDSDDLKVIDISGGEITSLIAHSFEAGNIDVRNNIAVQGELEAVGGITTGSGGLLVAGDAGITGNLAFESLGSIDRGGFAISSSLGTINNFDPAAGSVNSGSSPLATNDGEVNVELPFPVVINGFLYSHVTIGQNGVVVFETDNSVTEVSAENKALPTSDFSNPVICAFWDDLDAELPEQGAGVQWNTTGSSPHRVFNVFYDTDFSGSTDKDIHISIHLHETSGLITVKYPKIQDDSRARGDSATIGFQGARGSSAFSHVISYMNPILDVSASSSESRQSWSITPLK